MSIHARTITDFLKQHSHRVTHIVVAHTRYKTFECDDKSMPRIVEAAKLDCRFFRNRFNQMLYGKKAHRKPLQYQSLMLATLEGALINTDRNLTLHYNFSIGNLPPNKSDAELMQTFRTCWCDYAKQREDIWFENVSSNPRRAIDWIGYSMKEATVKGNIACWDFENTQIPYAAFDAG